VVGIEEHLSGAVEGGGEAVRVGQIGGANIDTLGKLPRLRAAGGRANRNAQSDQLTEDMLADAAPSAHDEGRLEIEVGHDRLPTRRNYAPRGGRVGIEAFRRFTSLERC
jgi:hypothetical protein